MLGSEVPEEQKRFFAIKLFERDDKIKEQMAQVPDVDRYHRQQLEQAMDDDSESIITNERYVYISSIIGKCCKKAKAGQMTTSDKIDRIVTNRISGSSDLCSSDVPCILYICHNGRYFRNRLDQ